MAGALGRLYTGTGAFDIVGRRRIWYSLSGLLVVVCLASILLRGFNLGIDFEGGTRIQLPAQGAGGVITTQQVERVFADAVGHAPESTQTVGTGSAASILIRSTALDARTSFVVKKALFDQLRPLGRDGRPSEQAISDSAVSATWGGEISRQALIALVVFLALVSVFLAIYFEPRMALAALIAVAHDVLVTAGIYSLVGFEVAPATVIGLLTILGFSLYDTVVVFDKVQENTRGLLGLTRRTYAEAANLAINQTLMRSINTSLIAVLPVLSLLVIGVGLLGVGTLKDLALVQMVGIVAGTMSSILLATPLVVDFTMSRPAYRQQAERVAARREKLARKAMPATSGEDSAEDQTSGQDPHGDSPSSAKDAPAASRRQPAGKSNRPSGKAGRSSRR
ncbi:MAG TPA: protein translocase subunit SecF [Pseudonocardiaceae bacterium]|nr:protein translocase subunit SecF [Pseudonocardiaceae bacterium]